MRALCKRPLSSRSLTTSPSPPPSPSLSPSTSRPHLRPCLIPVPLSVTIRFPFLSPSLSLSHTRILRTFGRRAEKPRPAEIIFPCLSFVRRLWLFTASPRFMRSLDVARRFSASVPGARFFMARQLQSARCRLSVVAGNGGKQRQPAVVSSSARRLSVRLSLRLCLLSCLPGISCLCAGRC